MVAVLAGDGTLNEAGGGLAGSPVALAPLPGGSTNVFARTIGLAYKPETAAQQVVDALARGSSRRIGLGAATVPGAPAAPLPLPSRHRVRRRHHPSDGAALVGEALPRAPGVRGDDAHDLVPPLRPSRTGSDFTVDGIEVGVGPYAVISNSDPYAYVGRRRACASHRARRSTRRSPSPSCARCGGAVVVRAAAAAVGRITYLTTSPEIVQRTDVRGGRGHRRRAVPLAGRRRLPGRGRAARGRRTRPTASPSSSPDAATSVTEAYSRCRR